MGRENLIITVMLLIFLFALMFGGGDARKVETRRPKFPSKESVARAKAFLDDNPVVDGYSYSILISFTCQTWNSGCGSFLVIILLDHLAFDF